MKSKYKLLTKSKFMAGLDSEAFLWRVVHEPETIPAPDEMSQARFDDGHIVGELAKKLYPEGIDLSDFEFSENIQKTKELIAERKIIFEAGFLIDRLYCRVDVLIPVGGNEWKLIEVKSSSEAKKVHEPDLAFQRYVCEKSGLIISACSVIHLDKTYFKKNELDIQALFAQTDLTDKVEILLPSIPTLTDRFLEVIDLPECPEFEIEDMRNSAYGNAFIDEFKAELISGSVFELTRGKKKALELWQNGIELLKDIPDDYILTEYQQIQRMCAINNEVYIDTEAVQEFVNTLEYPIYHLDFETFSSAVPIFDDTNPYMQVPFQYSVHIEHEDGTIDHREFLYTDDGDGRIELIKSLKVDLGEQGTVLVYYQPFEVGRLKEMAKFDMSYYNWVDTIVKRVKDLHEPFKKYQYYDPRQKGSASIKYVLPVFSDLSYKDLPIANGGQAMTAYRKYFVDKEEHSDKQQLLQDMLAYCKQDTWAMVVLLRGLKEKI